MQSTRIAFSTREDAIHFAEKQGEPCVCDNIPSINPANMIRLGLLCAAADSQAHTSEKLQVIFCFVSYWQPVKLITILLLLSENYVYKPNKLRIARTK